MEQPITINLFDIESVHIMPVQNIDGDTLWCSPQEATHFGIYARYSEQVQEAKKLSPTEWITDFEKYEQAERAASYLNKLCKMLQPVTQEEPEDNDKIFSPQDIYDFASETAQAAMSAGFSNSKSIEGKSMDDYIKAKMWDTFKVQYDPIG